MLGRIAEELALPLSGAQTDALLAYLDMLERWNGVYNLTAVRDKGEMMVQHLADCLAVVAPLRKAVHLPSAKQLLDVGSGGGLPGVVLGIMDSELAVTCVDTVGKKAAFVRQVAGTLRLNNVTALHGRVEALKTASFDVITSRAFARLNNFRTLTAHLLSASGTWLVMKGKVPHDELRSLPAGTLFHVEQLKVPMLDAERCLVWMQPAAARLPSL